MKQSYLMIFEMGRAQSVKKKGNFYLNVYQSLAMLFIEKKKTKNVRVTVLHKRPIIHVSMDISFFYVFYVITYLEPVGYGLRIVFV